VVALAPNRPGVFERKIHVGHVDMAAAPSTEGFVVLRVIR
jgi:hypothetical protein